MNTEVTKTVIEMEGYTFAVTGTDVAVLVRNKKSDKEIWRAVPDMGPVWKRVMKKMGIEWTPKADPMVEQANAENGDAEPEVVVDPEAAPDTQPDAEPEAEKVEAEPEEKVVPIKETKAARKRRLKAEREAKKAAATAE